MDDSPLIGAAEACAVFERLGVPIHRATFLRWAAKGDIATIHKNPGRNGAKLFARAEVEKLARDRLAERSAAA